MWNRNSRVKILFATTEAVPFCKTGGLGDVCGSLPRELANIGHEPVVVMPAFRQALNSGRPIEQTNIRFEVPIGRKTVSGTFLKSTLPGEKMRSTKDPANRPTIAPPQ